MSAAMPGPLLPLGRPWRLAMRPSLPYASDGLVAWYDGIWNAGLGVHDPSAATWKSLVGGYVARERTPLPSGQAAMSVGADHMDTGSRFEFTMENTSSPMTIEICSECLAVDKKNNNSRPCYVSFGRRSGGIQGNVWNTNCPHGGKYNGSFGVMNYTAAPMPLKGTQCRTWTEHSTCEYVYLNGAKVTSSFNFWDSGNPDEQLGDILFSFGNHNSSATGTRTRVFSVRAYSRVLTPAEVAANYAADRERFGLP